MSGIVRLPVFSSLLLGLILLPVIAECLESQKITVACVGDSITYGARLDNPEVDSYPAQLQLLLGKSFEVVNLGIGGSTLIRKGKPTVWTQLSKIRETAPDIVVISLGTNDTCGEGTCGQRRCWEYIDEYENDYINLIDTLRRFPVKPDIWICAPSPMVMETPGLDSDRIHGLSIRKPRLQELIVRIKQIAIEKEVGFIDLNTPLDHKPEFFTEKDGVHPNKAGYRALAALIYQCLTE